MANEMTEEKKRGLLLVLVYAGFISLGLPDSVLGVAWHRMHVDLCQPLPRAGIVGLLSASCSALSAFFSGLVLQKLGTGKLLAVCAAVTGTALLGYALAPSFWSLALFAIPLGLGAGAIDTGMNYFVAENYSEKHMSWLHCCWGLGNLSGPALMTLLLSMDVCWRFGYGIVAACQLILSGFFFLSLNLWGQAGKARRAEEAFIEKPRLSLAVPLCGLAIFSYCCIETMIGLWGFQYLSGKGLGPVWAGYAVTSYWVALTVGRFLNGFVAERLGSCLEIKICALLILACGLLLTLPLPVTAATFLLVLLGLFLAPCYPAMMHSAASLFDSATCAFVIGMQGCLGVLGCALGPLAFGYLADKLGFGLLPCAIVLLGSAVFLLRLAAEKLARR